jgi:hypothetical protein
VLLIRSAAFAQHTKSILATTKQRWVARPCGSHKGAGFSGVSGPRGCGAFEWRRKRSRRRIPAFGKRHAYGGQASRCPKYGRVRGGFALVRIRGHKKRRERFLGFARNDRRMQDAGLKDAAT